MKTCTTLTQQLMTPTKKWCTAMLTPAKKRRITILTPLRIWRIAMWTPAKKRRFTIWTLAKKWRKICVFLVYN